MDRPQRRRTLWTVALATLLWAASAAAAVPAPEKGVAPGVQVLGVAPRGSAAEAGLQAGDRLTGWRRADTEGPIADASAWAALELELLPLGPVTVTGSRLGAPRSWELRRLPTGLRPGPVPKGRRWEGAGAEALGAECERRGAARAAGWCFLAAAQEAPGAEARGAAFARVRKAGEATGDEVLLAALEDAEGEAAERARDLRGALAHYQLALEHRVRSGGHLAPVKSLLDMAFAAQALSDTDILQDAAERALALLEPRAPRSADMARALNYRGVAHLNLGEFAEAGEYFRRSLALWEALAPGTLDVARVVNNLAVVATELGALKEAQAYHERALALKEAAKADPLSVAISLNNLGSVASERGDFELAEAYHLRALAIREAADPRSIHTARSLNNLGTVAIRRREYDRAEELLQRSLTLKAERVPGTMDEATAWLNLGGLAILRGDLDGAQVRLEEYLARVRKLSARSIFEANALVNLATVARDRGDAAAAEARFREAVSLYEEIAPGSPPMAQALQSLGELLLGRGEVEGAQEANRRALAILEEMAPESETMASCLHLEAQLAAARGDREEELALLQRAVAVHESCVGRLGGDSAARTGYAAANLDHYHALLDALADRGEGRAAFAVAERMRARELLRMLAQRDIAFTADLPEALDAARRRLAAERDQAQAELLELSPGDKEAVAAVTERLRHNAEEQGRLREALVAASPRFAALQYPVPLDVPRALEVLDPGTLALSYAVLPEETLLFALGPRPGEFSLHRIPVGEGAMALQVRRFRRLVADGRGPDELPARLGRTLLEPVSGRLTRAKRLLLCPDGPLLLLPFAALAVPGRGGASLAEQMPLHYALSVTVWDELRRDRPAAPAARPPVLALADPALPEALAGWGLGPLPAAREESRAAAAFSGPGGAVFLGAEATEALAVREAPRYPYLHFACHGLLQGPSALDAGLALAPGEGANGLLQAWEIFEGLRLDADLAVLSACETAVGQAQGGEGLVGLSRAFQYAGARSLLVSLWRVDDAATAALMGRFYRHLAAGRSKAEALRAAQRELARGEEGPEAARPAHWAAFQLVGDWK